MNKKVIIWIIVIAIILILIFGLPGGKKESEKSDSQGKDSTAQVPGAQTGTTEESTPESTETTSGAIIDDDLLEVAETQEADDSVILSDEAVVSEPGE